MKLKNVLIVVKDIEKSRKFYHDLFGLDVVLDNDGNMILTEGLVLQDEKIWRDFLGKDIVPELMDAVDVVSISLNAPDEKKYMEVTRPQFENAFQGMLDFASECREKGLEVRFTVVDVLPDEEIKASRQLAESMGIGLRVRHFA